jgi:squalene cyclase
MIRKAVDWLVAIQNRDGGWGESCDSYKLDYKGLRTRAVDGVANGLGACWA